MSFRSIFTINPNHHMPQTGRKIKLLALSTLSVSIAACQGVPPAGSQTLLAEPNIPINQPYHVMDSDTASTDQVPNIVSNRWQDYYTDEKLKALITIGLENNKDMQSAILAIQKARAQYRITDIQDIPTISGSAGFERSANHAVDKNPSNGYSVNLAMSNYEFDFWGKISSLKNQALQSYLATTAAKDSAQIGLISNIAQAYVNLSYDIAQLNLATATVESREQSLFIAEERFKAGIENLLPPLQAEASLESAKIAVYEAQSRVQTSLNALQYLIGSPVPKQLIPTAAVTKITSIQQGFNAGLPSELLHYRPDILQAEYALKAAGAKIDVARATYFPSISLSGRLGVASGDLKNLFKNDSLGWSFGPSINLPIFDAGKIGADYHVAKIEQQEALVNYEKAIQTAFKEVSDVLAKRATLDKQLESQYKLQENFNKTYYIADARFKAGLSDYRDVLEAGRSQFAAQQSILNLELAKVISQIQLYQVLGGGANIIEPIPVTTETTEQQTPSPSDTTKAVDTQDTNTTTDKTVTPDGNTNDDNTAQTQNTDHTETAETAEKTATTDTVESQAQVQPPSAQPSQPKTTKLAKTQSNAYSSARVGTLEEVEKLRQAKYPHSQPTNKADDTSKQVPDESAKEDTNKVTNTEQDTETGSTSNTTNVVNTSVANTASPVSSQPTTVPNKPLGTQALVITETTRSKTISKPATTKPVAPSKQTDGDESVNNHTENTQKEKTGDTADSN